MEFQITELLGTLFQSLFGWLVSLLTGGCL